MNGLRTHQKTIQIKEEENGCVNAIAEILLNCEEIRFCLATQKVVDVGVRYC